MYSHLEYIQYRYSHTKNCTRAPGLVDRPDLARPRGHPLSGAARLRDVQWRLRRDGADARCLRSPAARLYQDADRLHSGAQAARDALSTIHDQPNQGATHHGRLQDADRSRQPEADDPEAQAAAGPGRAHRPGRAARDLRCGNRADLWDPGRAPHQPQGTVEIPQRRDALRTAAREARSA